MATTANNSAPQAATERRSQRGLLRSPILRVSICLLFACSIHRNSASAETISPGTAAALRTLPHPAYPFFAREKNEHGTVLLAINFDPAGKPASCRIQSTSAPQDLTAFVRRFVLDNWRNPSLAGKSIAVPFNFDIPIQGEFSAPPMPDRAMVSHEQGTVLLAVTFDKNGEVDKCEVKTTALSRPLTHYTCNYVEGNWSSPALAGKTIIVPINYRFDGTLGWTQVGTR